MNHHLLAFIQSRRATLTIKPWSAVRYEAELRWPLDDKRDFRETVTGATAELALDLLWAVVRESL